MSLDPRFAPLERFVTRRRFIGLAAGAGLGAVIASCGGSSGGSSTVGTGSAVLDAEGDLQVVKRFPTTGLVPGQVRLPISLADATGILGNDGKRRFPDTLSASVTDAKSGTTVASGITAVRRGDAQSVPYWAFDVEIDSPGVFILRLDVAPESDAAFQVEDPAVVQSPVPGRTLPPFDTPTFDDPRGVTPVCTRADEPCPFHAVTLSDALASGKPVAYLIGTPAYCKTGTCAPGLDDLITVAEKVGDSAVFVHADIYTDSTATTVAPAVRAYKLDFEPVLYVTRSDGTIDTRLDAVFEAAEIEAALSRVGVS